MPTLPRAFFARPTLDVARDLIGKEITFFGHKGIITETEAYIGKDDPACHAARGKTPRNAVMFEQAGLAYVYFIYGMYYCLNFVTEDEGFPAAVLIRGIRLKNTDHRKSNGPGKLCKLLGITTEHNRMDITDSDDFYVSDIGQSPDFTATPRIGISQGKELLWRFVVV
jgi:DNA-3-methyladenine glycosylase